MSMKKDRPVPRCPRRAAVRRRGGQAQPYPSKPIRFVLPFPAGSATDSIARIAAKDMAETLGQSIVVENKPGAGGAIAAEFVAKSPPDGYTLLVGSNTQLAANPSLFKKLSYDPVKDFAPVARLSTQPSALLVRMDFPAKNMAEFVAYAKANPKKLSAGYGASSAQVSIARLKSPDGHRRAGGSVQGHSTRGSRHHQRDRRLHRR